MFVEIDHLTKSYGGTRALRDVSVSMAKGEIHALCGENGAGKSTLIKCLTGTVIPEKGKVSLDGAQLPVGNVAASRDMGIAVIHQESTAFPDLDAVDNIYVGREHRRFGGLLLDRARMEREASQLLTRLGQSIPIRTPVRNLSLASRQMICLARALSQNCRLLILDEPTASLSTREANAILQLCQRLRTDGVSILYVSHRLEEVFRIADNVTVLRDGEKVASRQIGELDRPELVRLMVGRDLATHDFDREPTSDTAQSSPRLEVNKLTRAGAFRNISLQVKENEIVGIAGLVGAGRSELVRAIFGIDRYDSGSVQINGQRLRAGDAQEATRLGIGFVPEDRQHEGLVLPMNVRENVSLAKLSDWTRWGLIDLREEQTEVEQLARKLEVKANDFEAAAETLSGGNQQKLVIAKWLATKPNILIVDEPTRGVDVGAKSTMHDLLRDLTRTGMATLVVSSDLPELLALCDRIIVMREGELAGEMKASVATEEAILKLALPQREGEQADV